MVAESGAKNGEPYMGQVGGEASVNRNVNWKVTSVMPNNRVPGNLGKSFKESLLSSLLFKSGGNTMKVEDDDDLSENRWYTEDQESQRFNTNLVVHIPDEEFAKWCVLWKRALVVHLLGKRNSIMTHFLEERGHYLERLKIDRLTSIHSREKFVRLCVEIDLQKQLIPKIEATWGNHFNMLNSKSEGADVDNGNNTQDVNGKVHEA
ncbi:hypothetical protein VNO78_12389 [Psophocarpus tetragonolobus]|uniref:Uncharacterized protein n=1 Tax=Psophocarpus tetragonolobus TaxID=3891 RepID=A0AAN9XPT6_PSOTE